MPLGTQLVVPFCPFPFPLWPLFPLDPIEPPPYGWARAPEGADAEPWLCAGFAVGIKYKAM